MRPVSRRTLDRIYSVVGPGSGEAPRCRLPRPRAEAPVFLQRPETQKPIPELSFPLPPRTPPLPGGHALPLLTSGQWVDSPPEFHLFVGYCNFHLSNVHGNQWGEGSEEVLPTVKFLLLLPLLHFYLNFYSFYIF